MPMRTFRIAATLMALAVLGLVVWSVAAGGNSGLQQKSHGEELGGFGGAANLGHHLHHIHELIEDLDLSEDQQLYVQAIHEILMAKVSNLPAMHNQHIERSLDRLDAGYTDPFEVRQTIDEHIEALRHSAYAVSDQWVALGNSLDATQRDTLREHMEAVLAMSEPEEKGSWLHRLGQRIHGHGGGHGAGHGAAD